MIKLAPDAWPCARAAFKKTQALSIFKKPAGLLSALDEETPESAFGSPGLPTRAGSNKLPARRALHQAGSMPLAVQNQLSPLLTAAEFIVSSPPMNSPGAAREPQGKTL